MSVWIATLLLVCTAKIINTDPQRHLELEVGSLLQQPIPVIFLKYQHSSLVTLVKHNSAMTSSPVCEIRQAESGILREINAIHYGPEKRARDRTVINLDELRALRTFTDSIVVDNRVLALFEGGQVVLYQLNPTTGLLKQQDTYNITIALNRDAQFLQLQKDIFIISGDILVRVSPKSKGYTKLQINSSIYAAISVGNLIFVAAGRQGVYCYKYDKIKESATLVGVSTFYISQQDGKTPFAAHQIHVSQQEQMIYILDHEEGLLAAPYNFTQTNLTQEGKAKMLASGCRNLIVTAFRFYLTCPELVQLDKQSGTAILVTHLDFYAVEISKQGERLYLFGRRDWAVYDFMGRMISTQRLPIPIEKGVVLGNFLLAFSDSEAISYLIVSQREQLYCFTAQSEAAGSYEGSYQTEGLCQQYFEHPENTTDSCISTYPFTLKITDSAVPDYTVQLIVAGVWLFIIFAVSLIFAVKHFLVHRSYRELLEQQSGVDLGNEGEKESEKQKKSQIVSTV